MIDLQKPEDPLKAYPCIWLRDNLEGAVAHFKFLFPDITIMESSPIACKMNMMGTDMLLLMGGQKYQPTSAVSYFIYTGGKEKAEMLYRQLSEHGKVIFPLQSYPWAEYYAWVEDAFGIHWQIDADSIRSEQKIVPTLLFTQGARFKIKEARTWYLSIFPKSMMLMEAPLPPQPGIPQEAVLFTQMKLGGSIFNFMSSMDQSHDYPFTPGNSFVLPCRTQEEIDYYWEKLGKGGRYDMCGWLQDQYGVSWQIVPEILPELLNNQEKSEAVMKAFLKMQKFDISHLLSL